MDFRGFVLTSIDFEWTQNLKSISCEIFNQCKSVQWFVSLLVETKFVLDLK